MQERDDSRSTMAGSAAGDGRPGPTLYCPECAYNLTGIEQAGMSRCPECGQELDFDELREMAGTVLDLSRFSYWQLAWKLLFSQKEFDEELNRRHCNVRLPKHVTSRDHARGVIVCLLVLVPSILAGIQPGLGPVCVGIIISYLVLAAVAHGITFLYLTHALTALGHWQPSAAAKRILSIAATQCVPIALNLGVFTTGLTLLFVGTTMAPWNVIIGATMMAAAATLHFVLWTVWGDVCLLMVKCETQYRQRMLLTRFLKRLNPGVLVAWILPVPAMLLNGLLVSLVS